MDKKKMPFRDENGREIGYCYEVNGTINGEKATHLMAIITDKKFIKEFFEKDKEPTYEVVAEPPKKDVAKEIIDYLNEKASKRFKPVASNLKFINARLKEGYTIDDLKYVIDIKVADNKAGKFGNLYLRPETLFNATKFQGYINQEIDTKKPKDRW